MIIYIAGPYTSASPRIMIQREAQLTSVAAWFANCGATVFSPVTHGVRLAQALPPELALNKGFWRDQCLSMLRFCDIMVAVPLAGWPRSRGLYQELAYADIAGIPVFFPPSINEFYEISPPGSAPHRYKHFPKELFNAMSSNTSRTALRTIVERYTDRPFLFGDERIIAAAARVEHAKAESTRFYADGGSVRFPDGGSQVPLPEGPAPHADPERSGRNG